MKKKIILFCGVESTGKTTTINLLKDYLKQNNISAKVIYEYGRDVCAESGGIEEMGLFDYEKILFGHQENIIKNLNTDSDVILLDTDSLYTSYYLEKDKKLFNTNTKLSKNVVNLAKNIAKNNIINNRIMKVIYLNSDCPFIQDGTRTYEKTRKSDDKYLLNKYNRTYGRAMINVIKGQDFNQRFEQVINLTTDLFLSNIKSSKENKEM